MNNLYWPVYKNLEKETLFLAELVHFCDNQRNVFSMKIADLIVRCAVEIESLINELYNSLGVRGANNIGQKLTALNNAWILDKKKVSIVASTMHFSKEYSTFCPYEYRAGDSNDYYSAYNAIKHDRAKNFASKANVHFLLRSMAALYILNVYFQDRKIIPLPKDRSFDDLSFGSDIFKVRKSLITARVSLKDIVQTKLNSQSMYIVRASEKQYAKYQKDAIKAFYLQRDIIYKMTGNKNYLKRKFVPSFLKLAQKLADDAQRAKIIDALANIDARLRTVLDDLAYVAVLNKNQIVYPAIPREAL